MIRHKALSLTDEVLLNQLEGLAEKLEISVRYESVIMDESSGMGGICRINGKYVLIIHSRATTKEKVRIMVEAIRRFDLEDIYVRPAIRELLEKSVG